MLQKRFSHRPDKLKGGAPFGWINCTKAPSCDRHVPGCAAWQMEYRLDFSPIRALLTSSTCRIQPTTPTAALCFGEWRKKGADFFADIISVNLIATCEEGCSSPVWADEETRSGVTQRRWLCWNPGLPDSRAHALPLHPSASVLTF